MGIKTWCAALRPNSCGGGHPSKEHGASDCGNDGARQHRTLRGKSDPPAAQRDVGHDVTLVHLTCANVLWSFNSLFAVWLRVHV